MEELSCAYVNDNDVLTAEKMLKAIDTTFKKNNWPTNKEMFVLFDGAIFTANEWFALANTAIPFEDLKEAAKRKKAGKIDI